MGCLYHTLPLWAQIYAEEETERLQSQKLWTTPRKSQVLGIARLKHTWTQKLCQGQDLHKFKPDSVSEGKKGSGHKVPLLAKKLFATDSWSRRKAHFLQWSGNGSINHTLQSRPQGHGPWPAQNEPHGFLCFVFLLSVCIVGWFPAWFLRVLCLCVCVCLFKRGKNTMLEKAEDLRGVRKG